MAALSGIQIDLWAVPSDGRLDVPGVPLRDLVLRDWKASARDYDRIVYNLGNNSDYHRTVFEAYLAVPGVVVMHDRNMLGFFLNWLAPQGGMPPSSRGVRRFIALMNHYYGTGGNIAAQRLVLAEPGAFQRGGEWARYDLLEPCFANAVGLVTHSESALQAMSAHKPARLPTARLSLPFVDEGLMPEGDFLTRADLGLSRNRWILVSTGHLQPSKRVEVLLLAIGQSPLLRDRAVLVAVGDTQYAGTYEGDLRRLAHELGLDRSLIITGALDVRHYLSYIHVADACAALRSTQFEAASATLAEQLYFGKPTLVNRTGVFAEVPDDVVIKIDSKDEVGSTRRALELLIEKPDLAARYAERASIYAKDELSAAGYARGFIRFLDTLTCSQRLMMAVQEASDNLLTTASADSLDRLSWEYAQRIRGEAQCADPSR